MRKYLLFVCSSFLLILSCQSPDPPPSEIVFDFDGLISTQLNQLINSNASAIRTATLGEETEQTSFTPDSLQWSDDLDIFRELNIINKPVYHSEYTVTDEISDKNSNLLIRTYETREEIPVESIKFYYNETFENVKRVEAAYKSGNNIYLSTRRLTLEIDNFQDQTRITHYAIDGVQKMVLMDTVHFTIATQIVY